MVKHSALVLLVLATGIAQAGIYSYRAEDGTIVFTDEPQKGAKTVKVEEPMTVPAMKPKREVVAQPEAKSKPMWPEPQAENLPFSTDGVSDEAPAYDDSANTSWSSDTQGITTKAKAKKKKPASRAKKADASMITVEPRKREQSAAGVYRSLKIVSPTAGSSRWVGGELTVELSLKPQLQPEHVISLRVDGREVAVGPEMQMVLPNIERGGHTLRAAVLDVDTGKQLIVSDKIQFQIHRPNKNQSPRMLHPSVRKTKQ